MRYCRFLWVGVALLAAFGCVPSNKQLKMCIEKNHSLEGKLAEADAEIAALRNTNALLQKKLAYQLEVTDSSQKQNSALLEEYQGVKRIVRKSIQQQFNALSSLMEQEDLLDIVGYELLARKHMAGHNICLIDMAKPIGANGTLLGSWGYFAGPCTYRVQIIRPVGTNHLVIWESPPLTTNAEGLHKFAFEAPVRALKGDLIGYRFEGPVNVPYDLGIGSFGYLSSAPSVGSMVNLDRITAESDKRAYSLRVVGLLEN